MDEVKKQLWDKLQDDIAELNEWLQKLLEVWVNKWSIQEEEVISEIDDMDWNIKLLEKFYALTEKLWIKVVTIEEALEQEQEITKKETKLWKVSLYGGKTDLLFLKSIKFDEKIKLFNSRQFCKKFAML